MPLIRRWDLDIFSHTRRYELKVRSHRPMRLNENTVIFGDKFILVPYRSVRDLRPTILTQCPIHQT